MLQDLLAFVLGVVLTALAGAGIAQATGTAMPWQPTIEGVAVAAPAPPAPAPTPEKKKAPKMSAPAPKTDTGRAAGRAP